MQKIIHPWIANFLSLKLFYVLVQLKLASIKYYVTCNTVGIKYKTKTVYIPHFLMSWCYKNIQRTFRLLISKFKYFPMTISSHFISEILSQNKYWTIMRWNFFGKNNWKIHTAWEMKLLLLLLFSPKIETTSQSLCVYFYVLIVKVKISIKLKYLLSLYLQCNIMKIEIGKIIRLSFCKKITQKDIYTLSSPRGLFTN